MSHSDNASDSSAGEDLRISEIRYRRLFETARDGILILDAETRKITDVNPFMSELLDYARGISRHRTLGNRTAQRLSGKCRRL